jgi:putative SOS response-associated peptidase YedK
MLRERFDVEIPDGYEERYNVAPSQRVLAVRERDDGARSAGLLRWGLVPRWAKDAKVGLKMLNARAETLLEKPAYRGLVKRHRCLIVADGFYEWCVGADGKKHPVRRCK